MASNVMPIDPALVPTWVSVVDTAQYFQVATVTMLVYDTITTMDKEVKYFWSSPGSIATIVYFANRYIGILGSVSLLICNFAGWTASASYWFTIILIDYILMLRVLALYSEDKKLSVCLKVLLAMEAVAKLISLVYINKDQEISVAGLAKNVTVCGTGSDPAFVWGVVDWIIPLAYGLMLMALASYKASEFWRISGNFRGFNLVRVVVQDQSIYFLLAVSCCVFNIIVFKVDIENDFLAQVMALLGSPSFLCVLGSRMLFNLKEEGERGVNGGTSYGVNMTATMVFT